MTFYRSLSSALATVLLGLTAFPVAAHELGAVQAKAVFERAGTCQVDLVVDEEHLARWQQPGGAAACPPIVGLSGERVRRFRGALCQLARGAEISFDGRIRSFRAQVLPPAADDPPGRVVLRLHGETPGGARAFAFNLRVPVGTYPLALATEGEDGSTWWWLEPGKTSAPFALNRAVVPPRRLEVVRRYLALGFLHIVPGGLDHILFVLGLFLLSRKVRPLLAQVTCFTLAHTLSLGLSAAGIVSLPPAIVEPAIALSIVYVAVENVLRRDLSRSRLALVFTFGLLHGLGFAGVLAELGLPRTQFFTALLSFNAGVETGQLAVLAGAFLVCTLPFGERPWYRQRIVVPASAAIAAIGLFWSVERVLSFSGLTS